MKKCTVNPVAFCVWIWLFVVFGWIYALNCVLAIILHELGHYVVAKMLGYQLSKFSLSPYGVSRSYHDVDLDENDEFWIAVAGPAVNIVSIVFVFGGMLDLKQKSQYEKINIFCKKTKNFVKPTFYCVGFETTLSDLFSKMQSSKTCIFCITLESGKVLNLSDFFVQKLLTKYNIKTKLSEIIKNTNS